ncbi:glutathione transferase GST 23-like [Primulina eburnea]|uniref:glutathione transferase GST 23-like n=1 Tax=Primulina eburnea TaxID=1245227 RepID=UPI003C6C2093
MKNQKGVKILGFWVSPYVHRVRWALKLKGVEYEYIEEDIFNKSPSLFELNPVHARVPVLVHHGKPLPESCIILEYIDEAWKNNPLLPQHPLERAQARFWVKFAEEKVLGGLWGVLCSEGEIQEERLKLAMDALQTMEEILKGKMFFGGETIGYLDLTLGFISYMLPVWEEIACLKILDPSKYPALIAWIHNFLDHEAIKGEYMPSKEQMKTYFAWRRKAFMPPN